MRHRTPPPDLRLLPPVAAGWAATWIGLSLPPVVTLEAATAVALGAIGALLRARRRTVAHPLGIAPPYPAACVTMLVAAGLAVCAATHAATASAGPVPMLAAAQTPVTAELTVTGDPRRIAAQNTPPGARARPDLALVPVRITRLVTPDTSYQVGDAALVLARLPPPGPPADARSAAGRDVPWMSLLPSEHVRVAGHLAPARPGAREAAVLLAHGPPTLLGGPSALQAAAGALRADLREATSGLPAEEAGVLPALTLGDTSREPPDLADALKRTGLTYLTVVSGENLVFTTAALIPLLRRSGLRGRAVPLATLALVLGFTLLARPGPPMVRATATALLAGAAVLSGRRFRALPAMAAAVLVLLLIDPWLAKTYGFALSVAATAGLLVLAPAWCGRLMDRGVPQWAAVCASATAAAELCCEPILVTFSGALPLIAVVANVLAVPAAPAATVLGLAAMAGQALWPPLGHGAAWLAQWPVHWICLVARCCSVFPGASVPWPCGLGGAALLLAVYVLAGLLFGRLARRARARRTGSAVGAGRAPAEQHRPAGRSGNDMSTGLDRDEGVTV